MVEVSVRARSRADALRASSQAVTVVDLERARRGAADLGEVLARSEGVSVQRIGGLGSQARFSLAGFENEQVRFFLDGVPLSFAGYPFGIENVPVNLVERVEIYRGVVPIRFGADALGGALNLVSRRPPPGTHGTVSYQGGSFDTHRVSAQLSHVDEERGRYAIATGFFDRSRNDYAVDAPFATATGGDGRARVRRFHDSYTAGGATAEVGLVDRKWAERLSARVFFVDMDQDLQSELSMVQAYGKATRGALGSGTTISYKNTFAHDIKLELIANYAYSQYHIKDVSRCVYDWFGQCVNTRRLPGEIASMTAREPYNYAHSTLLRANLEVPFLGHHALLVSFAPNIDHRTGEDRSPNFPNTRDELDVTRNLYNLVSGASYRLDLRSFEGEAFVKQYTQLVRAQVSEPAGLRSEERNTHKPGAGTTLRYRAFPWLLAKASYEWTTRLPTADELLGNGAEVQGNVDLAPERSHNLNYELAFEGNAGKTGNYLLELIGFQRHADDLIFAQTAGVLRVYRNVAAVKVRGGQFRGRWVSPRKLFTLDGNLTYQDLRNESEDGAFADARGYRMPNRPYLFGTLLGRFELSELFVPRDLAWLGWTTRCVGEFDRTFENAGINRSLIERQILHFLALTYQVRARDRRSISTTLELQNITDAKSFDFWGAQRPGRAAFLKTVIEI
ncbi:MAG TPA: TonB-dependent receptor [Polyangiales bacterium]|nr:TonB-dependent receptor [Polyangiales bacterium]